MTMSTQPDNKRLMQQALLELRELKTKLNAAESAKREPIAVIGMGCRFPQADSPTAFWQLLRNGVDAVREIPADRWNVDAHYDPDPAAPGKMYTRRGGYLDEVYTFDPEFFGIPPREALTMDPQQRLLLEVSWEALEHAGLAPARLTQTETGVYIGYMNRDHPQWFNGETEELKTDPYLLTGNSFSFIAGRLSYLLGLQGPSMVVATECSSSLVTVHLACQALRMGECDLALAGGVNLILHPVANVMLSKLRALSSDGRCKTFDASGDGYGRGEGCGMVVLKRLSDAVAAGDPIVAVIRGSAVNHDGPSAGLTVPNGAAQEKLLRKALATGEIKPEMIDYIEAHGTGTTLGDPIEINALVKVFGTKRAKSLLVGSVKTNVGHLEAAAGIVGLIKVILAMQHEAIPAHLHLQQPNPHIAWDQIPVQVTTALTPWPKGDNPRLAGVSSFGLSGINAHLIVEESPHDFRLPIADLRLDDSTDANNLKSKIQNPKSLHLLTLSAKSDAALAALKERYIDHFAAHPQLDLADVCFTANTGRDHFTHRLAVVAASLADAGTALQNATSSVVAADPKVAFLFTGQGAQYAHMGRELYNTQPIFRQTIDRCDELLQPYLGRSLLTILYPGPTDDADLINQTVYTQPALFAIEYALAKLWEAWGIQPALVMGHSVGEYVAACVAGVFTLEDGLKLIAARSRLMGALPQSGSMVAIMAPVMEVADALAPAAATVSIAAVNGPQNVVISGETQAVQQVAAQFAARGIKTTPLTVSHAFHSPLMEPMLAQFAQVASEITYTPPRIHLVSNLTGTVVREEVATSDYWCHHVRQPVLFASGMETLAQRGVTAFVEIGPKPILLGMGRQCLEHGEQSTIAGALRARQSTIAWLPSLRPEQDWRQLLSTVGALHTHGVAVEWDAFHGAGLRCRVPLPTYPFQRKRYVGFDIQTNYDYAQKGQQTPIINLLHQGDATQLTQLLNNTGAFSAEQQALLPALLTALIQQHQTHLAAQGQNGQHTGLIDASPDGETGNPIRQSLWQVWQLTPDAKRIALLATALETQIAYVLGYRGGDAPALAHNCSLLDLGLDSLMGIELRNWVKQALDLELNMAEFLAGPSIDELATQFHEQLLAGQTNENSNTLTTNGFAPTQSADKIAIHPLSHGQQALWFIQQSAPDSSAYHVGLAFRIHSAIDVQALHQAFQHLVNRHAALRTTFSTAPDTEDLVQIVHPYQAVDFAQLDAPWSADELHTQVAEAYAVPFDLATGPLMRVRLFTSTGSVSLRAQWAPGPQAEALPNRDHVLLITFHHIICDARSTWTLLGELWTLYPIFKAGAPLPVNLQRVPATTYGDFARWQQTTIAGAEGERLWTYWQEQLADAQPILDLPTDRPRPVVQTYRGASYTLAIDAAMTEGLRHLARAENATLYMTLLAAYQLLLHRYTGQEDILVGSAMAGRGQSHFADVVGYFVNPVVLRGRLAGNPTFQAFLQQVRATALAAFAHQEYPYPLLVARLQPKRDPSRSPLFQVDFTLQKLPPIAEQFRQASQQNDQDVLHLEPFDLAEEEGQFDLGLHIFDEGETLRALFKYNTDLFAAATIERMAGHFQTLLTGILAKPQARLGELPLLTAAERRQLLVTWNETRTDQLAFPLTQCIHNVFEAQVARTPDAVAVILDFRLWILDDPSGDAPIIQNPKSKIQNRLTYRELNRRANQLAHYLRTLGVGPEVLVGVCLERSPDLVVAILAVLKAGGAYVPLDPSYPPERLAFMVEDAAVRVLLTHTHLGERLPLAAPLLYLDEAWATIAHQSDQNPVVAVQPENLAYVIYTSGSTGKPKGTLIEHRGLSNYLAWCLQAYNVAAGVGAPVNSSIGFDATITSFFSPLLVGGKVVLLPETDEIEALCTALTSEDQFSLVKITPAHLEILSHLLMTDGTPSPIKANAFVIGGEALFGHHLAFWQQHAPQTQLINEYGPTETVVGCCIYTAQDTLTGAVPIGRPIANTQLYILDQYRQPVPVGAPGELYIGGAGVARGYLNRPELTAERFLQIKFALDDSEVIQNRVYRTGDLARYLPDGNLEYLGRRDHQVKIRGYRIELGEIEAVLAQHPQVREVIVLAREVQTGDKQLVAYLVLEDKMTKRQDDKVSNGVPITQSPNHLVTLSTLRTYLHRTLPEYMVPSHFVMLEALPLTSNGKVDRSALPAPTLGETAERFVPPRDRVEMKLATIWKNILGLPQVGVLHNFFDLGGNSLLAVRLMTHIQQEFGKNLPLAALFQRGNVEQMAALLRQGGNAAAGDAHAALAPIQTAGTKRPFFCVPGAGGYVIYLYQLARCLGADQPFYGLQAAGLEGEEAPHRTVEEMAAYYIDALRTVQPEGPYYLGGHSLGGWVAFEMAQQLQRQGQSVALVAILDTPAPELAHFVDQTAWDDARWLVELAHRIKHLLAPTLDVSYAALQPLDAKQQLRYLQEQLAQVSLFPAEAGLEQLQRLLEIFKAHSQVRYTIATPVLPTPLALFRTQSEFGPGTDQADESAFIELAAPVTDGAWGWGAYGPTTVRLLPGDHLSILNEPHVHELADHLARALTEAQERAGSVLVG